MKYFRLRAIGLTDFFLAKTGEFYFFMLLLPSLILVYLILRVFSKLHSGERVYKKQKKNASSYS